MKKALPHRVGLAFGGTLGLWHLFWSVLVALGFAQPVLNFIFQLHMIKPVYVVQAFDFTKAVSLIILTTLIGYIFGYIIGWIWSSVHKA